MKQPKKKKKKNLCEAGCIEISRHKNSVQEVQTTEQLGHPRELTGVLTTLSGVPSTVSHTKHRVQDMETCQCPTKLEKQSH